MYIREGDRVRVLQADMYNDYTNKEGIVIWTDGYMYDVVLEEIGNKISVFWNDLKKIK